MITLNDIINKINDIILDKHSYDDFIRFSRKNNIASIYFYFDEFDEYVNLLFLDFSDRDLWIYPKDEYISRHQSFNFVDDVYFFKDIESGEYFDVLCREAKISSKNEQDLYHKILSSEYDSELFYQFCLYILKSIIDTYYELMDSEKSAYFEIRDIANRMFPNLVE